VDYVVTHGATVLAVEVKSGRSGKQTGLAAFKKLYPKAKSLLIGEGGVPLADFFERPAMDWLG
jgi:SNF family Na+-dependent transporter